jgi:hypothetical protein
MPSKFHFGDSGGYVDKSCGVDPVVRSIARARNHLQANYRSVALHLHVGRSRHAEHIIELAKVAFALYSRRAPGYCSARLADEPADGYPSYTGETHPWS